MRRIVLEEPYARTAVWSRSCALFAMAEAVIGILMARHGLNPTAAMAIEGGAVVIALFAMLFALIAVVVIWRTGYRGAGRLIVGLGLASLILAYPATLLLASRGAVSLADISTDVQDPPLFSTTASARAARENATYGVSSIAARDAQQRLYPDIEPLVLDIEPPDVFNLISKILAARHWRVIDAEVPLEQAGSGRIDAIASSTIMGFPADVTIRIRPSGDQSIVDIRSASRTRWHEPNADARRVQALASDIEDQVEDE